MCRIYQTLKLLFVYEDLIFTQLPLFHLSRKETFDSGDDLLTPLRNSKTLEFLFFHLCFSFAVSDLLQYHQRAGILHSFPAQRRSYHLNLPQWKIMPVEIQKCLVQFSVYFFSLF